MKHVYLFPQRSVYVCLIAVWLVALSNQVWAQQRAELEPGVFRIKVSEALAQQLESARVSKRADNVLLTGISTIDLANVKHKVSGIKRLFRDGGKFEAKHKRYGLHLWYEIELDKAAPVLSAIATFRSIENIVRAEPVYKKAIIGSDRKDYGPVRVDIEKLKADQPTLPGPSNDPLLGSQWHYNNTGQAGGTPGSDISLFQAWGLITGSSNVIVAVTDGGAQVDHPDLAANMWVNTDEVPGNNLDDDNNGYIDDINGYGFGDNTGTIAPDDHGTHTSGTIAAVTNNGIGVAGVAGGSGTGDGVRIMSCAAFGAVGTGGFAETYIYGADNGAVISQNSWGYTNPGVFEQAVLDAIDYFIAEAGKDADGNQVGPMRGGIVIFAAGNDNSNSQHYPGYYAPTLAVSAVNNQDKKAWYSNYGEWVDIAAPGGETFINNDPKGVLSTISGGQYAFFQGTSMACPHVSGVAALIVSKFGGPGFTPEMLRGRLTQLVDNIDAADPDFAGLLGSGRLNAFSALQEDDGDAPAAITDLHSTEVTITSVTLAWTSPADPGNGSASAYDIRYATTPITEENFASATAVADPPAPKPAGSSEIYTIAGLQGGITYYFAIKSADFFGNYSLLSNVLEQATNFPPVIGVSPAALNASLQTAGTTTQTLTISNTGLGVLNFTITTDGLMHFATPSPATGTVPAGGSQDIAVTFDASGLLAGSFQQNLVIFSNDPVTDTLLVPATLEVTNNGAPIASVSPDSLDFGAVFETGSKVKVITLSNDGSDPLVISGISSDNADFTTDFAGSITLNAFKDTTVYVTYTASSLGASFGTLTITTNDPASPTLTVYLRGEGVVAPGIEVSPTSLSATLNTDKTETQTLSVKNTGGSDLEFSVAVSSGDTTVTLSAVKTVTLPSSGKAVSSAREKKTNTVSTFSNQVKLKSVKKLASVANVLIVTPDNDVSDIEALLDAYDDIEADVYPKADLPAITLADIEGYDIVFTTNNTQWLASAGVEPAVIGDLLADYIDGGGKVIVNQFAYSYDAWKLEGRFIDEQYGPFTPSTTDEDTFVSLGDILSPGHPLVAGVTTLDYSGFVQNVGLAPGATAVAAWDNDELLLAANSDVVALNILPSLGNGGPLQWAGDLATIYENAVHYLAGSSFVSVDPSEATVAPGSQVDLEVTFDAGGLDAGIYHASIDLTTNVPNQSLVSVPAELTVLGPEFTVTPDFLSEELEKEQTVTRTLVLANNGPDNHSFSVSVSGGIGTTTTKVIQQPAARTAATNPAEKKKQNATARGENPLTGITALNYRPANGRVASGGSVVKTASEPQYATDFENFALGDVTGQDGWFGQFGNWTIEAINPFSGAQHFRGLSDGLGASAAVTPTVALGIEQKSTVTAKLNIKGTGVTWQIIPESPTAGFVNTRIQFGPDGVASALVSDGAGGALFDAFGTTPSGYFDLTIQVDRDSSYFDVFINDAKVYTGQGFAGNIEEVVVLSGMETAGPTLDLDDIQIIDGVKEDAVQFLTVSPTSGNLPSGASVAIAVTFNASDLEFGTYHSNINIAIGGTTLTVPATLAVVGDPNIYVSPTVLQAAVDYKQDTVRTFTLENTGGRPLSYSLQVIGAATDASKLPAKPVSKFTNASTDKRIIDKIAKDNAASRTVAKPASIQILTGASLLEENFEDASFPPSGWSVVDNAGTGVAWAFAADYGESNYAGTGEAATASSDAFGSAEFDTELITPTISTAGYKNIAVQYNANYQNFAGLDFLDLDIQVDGGSWTTVLSWNEDHGILREPSGEFVTVSLAAFTNNASSFRLRWHYYDPNTDDFDWYAQIDDVVILGDARAWLTVNPASGVVPVQGTAVIEAEFDAADLEPGFYVAGILVNSNAVVDPVVGVVASLAVREPAVIAVDPDSLYQELPVGGTATQTLTISNTGASILKYAFGNAPVPDAAPVSIVAKERKAAASVRTTPTTDIVNLRTAQALVSTHGAKQAATPLYVTGFEEFAPGDIDGQEGWEGQWGNWTIESINPFEDAQHFRGLSDGLGQSLAFSPLVAIGSDPISSTAFKLNITGSDVTWQVIPQSPTAQLVNTRFQIAPDGSLSALTQDSVGNVDYTPIPGTLPSGYFELRIDVERATSIFTIYVDGTPIFTGQGFAGDIEQVVLFSLMEEAGSTFDIDNLAIYDGPATAPWLTYNPKSGTVPPGGSATITVSFNAEDLVGGWYADTLRIASNDPATPVVSVPVALKVIENHAPVLDPIDTAAVAELTTLDVTFTATDADNDPVTVELQENLSFISLLSSANGTATYRISPLLGHAGEYDLPVLAIDSAGATDTAYFHLSVLPYGVASFSLVNLKTGQVISTFTDSATIDVGTLDLYNVTIRANTNPAAVGSVRFIQDGKAANLVNTPPYNFNPYFLYQLTSGQHTLRANAFTRVNGTGTLAKSLQAVITLVNSTAVTDLDVVRSNGIKLKDLANGTVVDITQQYYNSINIRANTFGPAVKSVVFELNGAFYRTDNNVPYALHGNGASGSDTPWPATPGTYTITATPYSYFNGTGTAGIPTTITFQVVNGATSARFAPPGYGEEDGEPALSVYPVPVKDELTIQLKGKAEGNAALTIHNTQGISLFNHQADVQQFRNYTVSTNKLGLSPGVYVVQIQLSNGKREIRKFVKE
ncbi:MAG TPA: S8 family serine peptidase [Ohtaekwangia sp.]|uniref:Ig-like domain-containing protein n=1 Tax=Ohtaekwangia sp. TaxID=2066019 RepID=UPI002F939C3B